MNPDDKRSAIEVEDHPLEYRKFSGTIPERRYGAGHVIIRDQGAWQPRGDFARGVSSGRIEFTLRGKRLKGGWRLIRLRSRSRKNEWLLLETDDEFATRSTAAAADVHIDPVEARAATARAPGMITPQLATDVTHVPEGARWLSELKLDGYRLLAHVDGAIVRCYSRNGIDWSKRFSRMTDTLRPVELADTFDIPAASGADLRDRPLIERKRILRFAGWTQAGRLRHPVFLALREDRVPREVTSARITPEGGDVRKEPRTSIEGPSVTHPTHVVFAEDGIAKVQRAAYYEVVSRRSGRTCASRCRRSCLRSRDTGRAARCGPTSPAARTAASRVPAIPAVGRGRRDPRRSTPPAAGIDRDRLARGHSRVSVLQQMQRRIEASGEREPAIPITTRAPGDEQSGCLFRSTRHGVDGYQTRRCDGCAASRSRQFRSPRAFRSKSRTGRSSSIRGTVHRPASRGHRAMSMRARSARAR